jgi:hypothetical protein
MKSAVPGLGQPIFIWTDLTNSPNFVVIRNSLAFDLPHQQLNDPDEKFFISDYVYTLLLAPLDQPSPNDHVGG